MAGSVGAFLAVSAVHGDPRLAAVVAFLIGAAMVILGTLLQSRMVIDRVPFLRPAGHELSRLLKEADRLRTVIPANMSNADQALLDDWHRQVLAWGEDARRTVAKHLPDREYQFARSLETDFGTPTAWYDGFRRYVDPRIARLEELIKEQR